jgi:hypothetical protein
MHGKAAEAWATDALSVVCAAGRVLHAFAVSELMSAFDPLQTLQPSARTSDMRPLSLIALLVSLGACQKEQPLDCMNVDLQSEHDCFEQNRAKGERASLLACLPFSEPLMTTGIWVVGFEKNDFFEGFGKHLPAADFLWTEGTGASLIVDDDVRRRIAPVGPKIHALQVDVVGRRALCPVSFPNAYPIVVEKLEVRRRIGTR